MTWQDILTAIREGKASIPTAESGIPLVAFNAPFYELMEMMEALTTGYNNLVARADEDQKRIERIRKLAEAHFPADRKAEADGWISVEDMLPTKSGEYFTYGSDCGVYPLHYSAKHRLWYAYVNDTPAVKGVTHWYPRPAAPAIERKED